MMRAGSAIGLAAMTAASAVLGAILAGPVSFPLLLVVFYAFSWLGVELPCFGELVMAGPFLAGIGGFLFGTPCGAVACLSRSTTGMLSRILTMAIAMTVATLGALIGYWLLVAPRATVPESTVMAGGVALPIAVGLAVGAVVALVHLIPFTD